MKIFDNLDIKPKAGTNLDKSTMQLCRAWYNSTASTPTWIHIKTNIPKGSGIMYAIHAEGYNYGTARSIDCVWTGYTYGPWGNSINNRTQYTEVSNGLDAQDQYYSTDNYLVLTANASSFYYIGFVMHAYFSQGSMPSGGFRVLEWSRQSDGTTRI